MTELHETAAMIGLLRRGGRVWHQYADLVESTGSAIEILAGGGEPGGTDEPAGTLFDMDRAPSADAPDLDAIVAEIRGWQAEGIQVLSVLDEEYPPNLRTIHNRPPLLFVRGALTDGDVRSIAIVGTRRATDEGLAAATSIAGDLAQRGFTVISGLAEGVDSAAHRAALAHDRRTVAVIGTGIRRSYPAKNAELQREIASEGAVVSQFWPDAPPTRTSFPMRNIVMSGLSQATVVIEASHTSGAKMQARFALEHGRPVFLLASLLEHEWAREYAERPGAHVIENAADVAEHVERLTSIETLSI
jgi:DNA processing protein